jgi:hypothetical protein
MAIVRVLARVWIPLVALLVLGCGGFIVLRVHAVAGSDERPTYAEDRVEGANPFNAKQVLYEVFGPANTVAEISYFNDNSEPRHIHSAPLPWSLTMTVNSPAVVADVVAQGDSDSIGCRIVVDGDVKVERTSHEVNAFTHCLLNGA